ncbi:MAG: hypothetical protein K8R68_11290 [Bacteroidales bacterium]|nr:hypothetical protein [Bacteroidales bacterium]
MKNYLIFCIIIIYTLSGYSQNDNNTPVPFTLADRDRILRTEQRLEAFQISVDKRFESLHKELDAKFESIDTKFESQQKQMDNMYILLILILGAIFSLIGFVIYDRRTAIKPVQRKQEIIEKALQDYSGNHNDLKEILKKAGIL